jgi:hypothetical protein
MVKDCEGQPGIVDERLEAPTVFFEVYGKDKH